MCNNITEKCKSFSGVIEKMTDNKKKIKEQIKKEAEKIRMDMALITGI